MKCDKPVVVDTYALQSDNLVQTTTRTITLVEVIQDGEYLKPLENRTDFIEFTRSWSQKIQVVDRTVAVRTHTF